ncbi:MAG: outer membrane beta-barrel protein, partial [Longimicrobiales bacterium]
MKLAVRIASAVLLLALHGALHAQVTPPTRAGASAPGKISGLVQTAEGQPLPAVAITIRSALDSAIVTGALTGKDGRFVIDGLPLGGYLIRVSLIGYKPRSSETVTLSAQTLSYDFGTIKLDVVPIELKAVEAVAERSAVIVEADRTVYSTKAMPAAAGTAVDVLRAVPELEVDINDNVKLRGNQSAVIQLNGRPAPLRGEQLANFLKQLPGNRIDRVEVMPNPSAKNDPEGMGGIINIVLKENVNLGLSGSISANGSTRNQQYMNGRINYQRGPFTIFTGAGGNMYQQESSNWDLRENLITQPSTSIEQNSVMDNDNSGLNMDWTAEYKLSKQATIWSNSWMWYSDNSNSGLMQYNISQSGNVVRERYDRDSDNKGSNFSYDIGLGLVQVFQQQKHELRIDSRISRHGNDSRSRLTKLFLMSGGAPVDLPIELTLNDIESKNGNLFLTTDYFRPLGKGRLDLGYQTWKRDQDNDNWLRIYESEEATDTRQDTRMNYLYDETFHSLYALYGRTIGKFAFQAGARAQFSNTDFTSLVSDLEIDRSYKNLFPSFNVSFTP